MKIAILKDAKYNGKLYTVLRTEPSLPAPIAKMPFVPWPNLGLDRAKIFDSPWQHCFGLEKEILTYKIHRESKFCSYKQYVSFNRDIVTLMNTLPEEWVISSVPNIPDHLEYLYLVRKEYLLCLNDQIKSEEDQGYTQGYKDGCTGLKWL